MTFRLLLCALCAALMLPATAAAHPSNATNSFAYGLGGASAWLTSSAATDDEAARFTTSNNMVLRSFTPREPGTPNVFNDFISDLAFWGDRVYQGTFDGFRIIDAADIDNPVVLQDFDDCSNANGAGQGDVVVWGSILVRTWDSNTSATGVTCDGKPVQNGPSGGAPGTGGFEGLHVFDVSNPSNPDLIASVDLTCGSHTATGVPDLSSGRLLVYSTPSSGNCDGIDIVEVPLGAPAQAKFLRFEPAGPNVAGADGFACHDTGVILGSAMKAACAGGVGFAVWSLGGEDGGSLEDPQFLYNHALPEIADRPPNPESVDNPTGHSAAFSWDGDTIIFGHEPGGGVNPRCQQIGAPVSGANGPGVQTANMKSFFFFDTDSGRQKGKWTLTRNQSATENCTLHNYNVIPLERDDILVQGSYQSGTGVLNFDKPSSAREMAFADPAPLPDPPGPATIHIGGSWATYFYNGYLFDSDITRGLYIWELDEKEAQDAMQLDHLNPQTQEFTISDGKDD
ncbi:MAG TPA: hypothetical protein VFY91_00150 [Microbacterium sp.]|nr:hypothetical protein [Microbacterium sp.]